MEKLIAKKSLGQNFLHDENILQKIASSIEVKENDLIIEIGPGKGALTKYLVKKCQVVAFEIDTRMKDYLNYNNLDVYYQDFLKVNLQEILNNYQYENLYIIANIPYYITTPIIEYIINSNINIQQMVLLVQKEVAMRFSALPGSKLYSSISVYLQYYFNIQKLFDVSNKCFSPVPKVDSAVIKFTKKNKISINEKLFFKLVRDSFQFKRKTLKNNLYNYNWAIIKDLLISENYQENVRAEDLPLEIFIKIANLLDKK